MAQIIERVRVSELKVAQQPTVLKIFGLGSCVALALHDRGRKLGGLAHILLPGPAPEDGHHAGANHGASKFADQAVPALIKALLDQGGKKEDLQAVIAGGSNMFLSSDSVDDGLGGKSAVGHRNVEAVRKILEDLGVEVRSEDVGGSQGRTVTFDPATGEVVITNYKGERKVI